MKYVKRLSFLFMVYMFISYIKMPDYVVQNFLNMVVMIFFGGLLFGAIGFRMYLIGRGTMKIVEKLSK